MGNLGVAIIKYCFYKKSNWSGIGAGFLNPLKIKEFLRFDLGSSPASSSKMTDFYVFLRKNRSFFFTKNYVFGIDWGTIWGTNYSSFFGNIKQNNLKLRNIKLAWQVKIDKDIFL